MSNAVKTTTDRYEEVLKGLLNESVKRVISRLVAIGEECVSEAIEGGNYTDRTGNLRSSIGYVVAQGGRVLADGGFYQQGASEDGVLIGRAKANELASDTGDNIVLYIVAGMDYATYVADKGYNVLDSADIVAQQLLGEL